MSRKYSLAYLTLPGTAPVDQIRIAAEAGYDFGLANISRTYFDESRTGSFFATVGVNF